MKHSGGKNEREGEKVREREKKKKKKKRGRRLESFSPEKRGLSGDT